MWKSLLLQALISSGSGAEPQITVPVQSSEVQHTIEAFVKGLVPKPGSALMIGLLDKDGEQLQGKRVPVDRSVVLVRFDPVPAGTYAIRFFQDDNQNDKLDLGLFGIPKEGVGASNDARGFMAAPGLKDMLFEVSGPKTLSMQVNYY